MLESLGLFLWSVVEAIFFPIPPDGLLMALALKKNGLYLGAITTIGSILGALIGYYLGIKGGRPLLKKWVNQERLYKVEALFNKYDVWVVMVAGFTPIPYKVFAISAGVFQSHIPRFIVASLIGRGLRFMLEGYFVMVYGAQIIDWLKEYFDTISLLLVAGIIVLVLLVTYLKRLVIKRR
ncbi:MAG: DedA family protein [Firmicutes bacterium]|nr:DedA family protein [Bacillota bacterium]